MKELLDAIPAMEAMISRRDEIKNIVTHIISKNDAFFIGRGLDYAFSLEGALKLKEISYIHAEAYAAGELKHGTISLIEEGTLVIGVLTQSALFEKTVSNMLSVRAVELILWDLRQPAIIILRRVLISRCIFLRRMSTLQASLAVIPLQDYLCLGTEARINLPSTLGNNWKWRLVPGQVTDEMLEKMCHLNKLFGRL